MFAAYSQSEFRSSEPNSSNAEPMTIGSPVSSPKSKTNASQNYLPPYLVGEVASSPVGTASWNSPKQTFPSSPFSTTPLSHFREQHTPLSYLREQQSYQSSVSNTSIISTPTAAKSGGPPIQGLLYSSTSPVTSFDTSVWDTSATTDGFQKPATHNVSGILTPSKSFSVNNSTFMSPAQIDPFFTQGEALKNSEQLDESWVTVFGFPQASASYILQQFSQYGSIIEHKVSPNGNWMHIRYQSKLQAKKALSKNGKIFSGNIMIGVKTCIEMDLMDSTKENSMCDISTSISNITSPVNGNSMRGESTESTKPSLKNIRPLTQAYQSPKTPTQAVTPKSGNIVSKALDYFFYSS